MALFGLIGKKKSDYPFHVYDRSGKHVETTYANLMVDQENRERRHFVFDKFKDKLDVRQPTKWVDGKPYREATFGVAGEMVYLEGTKISSDNYLENALKPEERQITASKIKENTLRYAQPMNKWQAIGFLALIVLVLVVIGGTVYSVISETKISANYLEATKESGVLAGAFTQAAATNQEVTEELARITSALTGDANLTRQLS